MRYTFTGFQDILAQEKPHPRMGFNLYSELTMRKLYSDNLVQGM
jgi:hypothetical protein